MTKIDLRELTNIEIRHLEIITAELNALSDELSVRAPTLRESAAAAAFLAQFQSGVENILKLFCRAYAHPIPNGEMSHLELFELFCEPAKIDLPVIFDTTLATKLSAYRKFRHVALHSYAFQLDWEKLRDGVSNITEVFSELRRQIISAL